MNKIEQVSAHIADYFGSNANFYVKQIGDGSYRKTAGVVNAALVRSVITNRQSIACYQRNVDHTLNWICFDFDILKINIGTGAQAECEASLLQVAQRFVEFLSDCKVFHILEFSGNRGIHVWINFARPILPHVGFEIVKYLLDKSGISIDRAKIGLDLFPASASHKSSHGKAVKVPLSRHTKSGLYSVLLSGIPHSFAAVSRAELDEGFLNDQLAILHSHSKESVTSIEQKLGFQFEVAQASDLGIDRVRKIRISPSTLSVAKLIAHWLTIPLVAALAKDIQSRMLSHARRQLLVGLLARIVNRNEQKVGQTALLEIFGSMSNFDRAKTESALAKFTHLPFPSLEIVESLCNFTYGVRLDSTALATLLIPEVYEVDDGLFSITAIDLKVTAIAERNYLYQNDEVRCIPVIEEITDPNYEQLVTEFEKFISGDALVSFYRHNRRELNKDVPRPLVTLSASSRLFSTWSIKHLTYIYDHKSSPNSYGYKMNPNFAGGHIFKPWLYQWVEFLSDIADVLNNELHSGHYIVKADIKSFYDTIPQDNLERMLLTGFNGEISDKLELMQIHSSERYKNIVRSLVKIIQECNSGRIGVPQGPAFARVLAELYLGQIDELMDGFLAAGELLFYHRYVDDIFFVVPTRADAEVKLGELKNRLTLLGLSLNAEKTSIHEIGNFDEEFNKYRAQSKYAIDAISSNIDDATPYEKNVALLEYNKLIAQQDDNDDAVFLFSHLSGFEVADRYRNDAVNNIVLKGVGRGNLFKHVFIYLLNSPDLWPKFSVIETLTELQSEVFTSVCVDILSDQREAGPDLILFIDDQLRKLSDTKLVNEHRVYLQLYFNVGRGIAALKPTEVLRCIQIAENPDRLVINSDIVELTASSLNGVTDIGEFVSYLYPMCVEAEANRAVLSALAKIFSAKVSDDEKNGKLKVGECGQLILTKISANNFYQLLCLFTLSTAITSRTILESAWKFCATVFNSFDGISNKERKASWYKNFDHIDVHTAHLNLVVTSITDGAIWRGTPDTYGIYGNFHNSLMVLVLTGEKNQTMDEVRAAIGTVADVGAFYLWLFGDDVDLFPSRNWFIENLTRNDCILLRRTDEVLIRKRIEAFKTPGAITDVISKSLIGYADQVVPYLQSEHKSVCEVVAPGRNFFTNFSAIKRLALQYAMDESPPNFFSPKPMLTIEGNLPFSQELVGAPFLIYERNDKIEIAANNFRSFLKYLFLLLDSDRAQAYPSSDHSMTLSYFYSRYITVLDAQRDVPHFMRRLDVLFEGCEHNCDEVVFDLSVSSALYATFDTSEAIPPFWRVKSFLERYNRFHRAYSSKHIYMVGKDEVPKKDNIATFLNGILGPLDASKGYRLDLPLGLAADIRSYGMNIAEMILEISPDLELSSFVCSAVSQSIVTEKISINGLSYSYDSVFVVNPAGGLNQSFSSDHVFLLQASEDTFSCIHGDAVFLFFMPKELTICFFDILDRYKYFYPVGNSTTPNYPYLHSDATIDRLDINGAAAVIAVHRGISTDEASQRVKSWLRYIPGSVRQPILSLIEAHEVMFPDEILGFAEHFNNVRCRSRNAIVLKRFRDFGGVHRILADDAELARALDDCGPDSIPPSADEISVFADTGLSGGQIVSALDYYLETEKIDLNKVYFCNSDAARQKVGSALRSLKSLKLCFVLYTDDCINKIQECLVRHGLTPKLEVAFGRNISSSAFLGSSQRLSLKNKAEVQAFLLNLDVMDHLMKSVFMTNGATRRFQKEKLARLDTINLVSRFHSMPKKALDFLSADLRGRPDTALFQRVRELGEIK
jgi:hypothetical protein